MEATENTEKCLILPKLTELCLEKPCSSHLVTCDSVAGRLVPLCSPSWPPGYPVSSSLVPVLNKASYLSARVRRRWHAWWPASEASSGLSGMCPGGFCEGWRHTCTPGLGPGSQAWEACKVPLHFVRWCKLDLHNKSASLIAPSASRTYHFGNRQRLWQATVEDSCASPPSSVGRAQGS